MLAKLLPYLGVVLLLPGCGSWQRVGTQQAPTPTENLTGIIDLDATYRRMGRLTAGAPLPFVASLSYLGGSGDSTVAIIAISLENRTFGFQKEGSDFVARYRVDITAAATGKPAVLLGKEQTIRVRSFSETQRPDESVLFQDALRLWPGAYHVTIALRDNSSNNSSRTEADVTVPAFPPGSFSAPILAYRAKGRVSRSDPIGLIVNPRGTISYGGDTALAYVEAYDMPGPGVLPLVLVDADDSIIARDTMRTAGGQGVEGFVYRFAPDEAPLGQLELVAGDGKNARRLSALVSFSGAWITSNFDDMLSLLRYFPESVYLDSLRNAPVEEHTNAWRKFYRETDPDPGTPSNETLDQYLGRIAMANQRFTDEGIAGWRTDRGEVFIRIGEPDEIFDSSPASEGRVIRWNYITERLTLFFSDETGFGHFKLTQASRADFERVVSRIGRKVS